MSRTFSRYVDTLRKQGSISEGVELKNGGKFLISVKNRNREEKAISHVDLSLNDNIILACALEVKNKGGEVVLVSKDINLRVKADVLGVQSDDYGEKIVKLDELYTGSRVHEISVKAPQRV